jgi:DNA-binding beta-propeller fold protein YncE
MIMRKPQFVSALLMMAVLLTGGCSHDAGVIFPLVKDAPVWPAPPEAPRIRYVGQLTGSADLKPAVSGFTQLGNAVFGGGEQAHTFLIPMAVCTDGSSRVFVADSGDHVIHVLDLETRKYARWTPTGRALITPVGLAYDSAGRRLFVADSGAKAVFIFDMDGKFVGELGSGQFKHPCGLAVDPGNGRVFVADVGAHQILVLSPTGHVLRRLGARGDALGQFNYPTNVAVDHRGRLYVSDSLNFRVQQFTPDLAPIRQIGKQGDMPGYFAQPKGIALDQEDHLYVVDSQFEAVQIFDDTGELLLNFGEQGQGRGQFWLPTAVFIDPRNRIWVADSFNHRLQVFEYLPEVKP